MATTSTKHCVVEIGGIPVGLSTTDAPFFDLLRQRYAGFLSSNNPQLELEFDLADQGRVSDADVCVRRNGHEWEIERGDFQARWDARTGRGHVRQNPNPYSLDSVLRILHSLVLAARGGFLLHASSGICDGRAYLFSGVSGAGKTTMTRLAPPGVILLTDEISYVRPELDGYVAFGTPFSGELAKAGENCKAPIGTLFFLKQGSSNRIDDVSPSEAVRRLMRNIL